MFQFFSSFGASSDFQKHRLILTSKSYQAPDQTSLKKIIQTFRGEDEETRSQIAFATIIKKIHTSDSNDNWVYLLKNLIILDRVVEENCFLDQIASLELQPIKKYEQKHEQAKVLNSQRILKSFWKLVQYKSELLCRRFQQKTKNKLQIPNATEQRGKHENSLRKKSNSKSQSKNSGQKTISPRNLKKTDKDTIYDSRRSILSVLRSQKQQFVGNLTCQEIFRQSVQIQNLFDLIFKVVASIQSHTSSTTRKLVKSAHNDDSQQNNFLSTGVNFNQNRAVSTDSNTQAQKQSASFNEASFPKNSSSTNDFNQKFKGIRQEFFTSRLISYMHLQILYKLLSLYTNQMFCIKAFMGKLFQTGTNDQAQTDKSSFMPKSIKKAGKQNGSISQKETNAWKKVILNYLSYSQRIIDYVERHKSIKGFELINYNELSPFQKVDIIAMLDDFIQHKNKLEEPDIVRIQELGIIMGRDNNQIKVQRKAQWSYQKALTARKIVSSSRKTKDKNNSFFNWQNSFSNNFPPKQVLTVDLIMEMRQHPHNPATSTAQQEQQQQSIYQPFIVNRHSCIYNFRESNISGNSQFQFIPLQMLRRKQEEQVSSALLQSVVSKKSKNFYYFKSLGSENQFRNIYSSLLNKNNVDCGWVN